MKSKLLIFLLIIFGLFLITPHVYGASQSDITITSYPAEVVSAFNKIDTDGFYYFLHRDSNNTIYAILLSKTDYPDLKYYMGNSTNFGGKAINLYHTSSYSLTRHVYTYNTSTQEFVFAGSGEVGSYTFMYFYPSANTLEMCTNADIYTNNTYTDLFYKPTTFKEPTIVNSAEDLATGTFDYFLIACNSVEDNSMQFTVEKETYVSDDIPAYYTPISRFLLSKSSTYFNSNLLATGELFCFYEIPLADTSINFENGVRYRTFLTYTDSNNNVVTTNPIYFTIGGLTDEDKIANSLQSVVSSNKELQNSINNQTEKIEEQTEVNKSILQKIVDLPGQIVNLLIDGIKSLFIPEDGYFSNFFDRLMDFFSDRFGFLFYPFDLILDLLDRIVNINFQEPRFEIPDINEPFTNVRIISATSFNFNDLLSNPTLNTVHNIFLVIVDAVIFLGLINLFKKKLEEVMG